MLYNNFILETFTISGQWYANDTFWMPEMLPVLVIFENHYEFKITLGPFTAEMSFFLSCVSEWNFVLHLIRSVLKNFGLGGAQKMSNRLNVYAYLKTFCN